ncbi:MAG: extracellular solute-binding protein [Deltaproteobacteria bacterium]|nr:extracellular solute-binding protein [Deltaproteobacteria bacterium]
MSIFHTSLTFKLAAFTAALVFYLCIHSVYAQENLLAQAREEKEVIFYSSLNIDGSQALATAFERRYSSLKVNLLRVGSEKLLSRLLLETKVKQRVADVVCIAGFQAHYLKKNRLLGNLPSDELDHYSAEYVDPDKKWLTIFVSPFVWTFNTRQIPPDRIPRKLDDLVNPFWKGKIGLDPEEYEWFANTVSRMGKGRGMDFMKRLAAQEIQFRSGHTLMAQLIAAGEIPLGLAYGYRVEQMRERGAPLDWMGLPPVIALIQPVAVMANPVHPAAARLFTNFVFSEEGQKIIAATGRVPTRKGVKAKYPRLAEGRIDPSEAKLGEETDYWVNAFRSTFGVK